MMRIETSEKHDLFAGSPADIVNAMNADTFIAEATKLDYMEAVARRVLMLTGTVISDTDARAFLYGLKRAGLIRIYSDTGGGTPRMSS